MPGMTAFWDKLWRRRRVKNTRRLPLMSSIGEMRNKEQQQRAKLLRDALEKILFEMIDQAAR